MFANICPNLPDVRSYPTFPYFSFRQGGIKLFLHSEKYYFMNMYHNLKNTFTFIPEGDAAFESSYFV